MHGDYRIDNVIFHPTEPRVLAVLDWELSTLGHPLSDFAYQVMAWRLAPEEFRGLKGCDFAALGIPTEDEYVAAYCRRTGREAIAALGRLPHLQHVPDRGDPAWRARARAARQCGERECHRDRRSCPAGCRRRLADGAAHRGIGGTSGPVATPGGSSAGHRRRATGCGEPQWSPGIARIPPKAVPEPGFLFFSTCSCAACALPLSKIKESSLRPGAEYVH